MFSDESAAYGRMVSNSLKTGNEEFSVISDNGILVLPSYDNTPANAKFEEYGYNAKNGNLVDGVTGKELNTVALAHTHPTGSAPSGLNGDGSFMAANFPDKPNYVIQMREGEATGLSYIISNGTRPFSWQSGATGSLSNSVPGMTTSNLLRGKISLKSFTRQNINIMKQGIGR
jgi:hypothetical protein